MQPSDKPNLIAHVGVPMTPEVTLEEWLVSEGIS